MSAGEDDRRPGPEENEIPTAAEVVGAGSSTLPPEHFYDPIVTTPHDVHGSHLLLQQHSFHHHQQQQPQRVNTHDSPSPALEREQSHQSHKSSNIRPADEGALSNSPSNLPSQHDEEIIRPRPPLSSAHLIAVSAVVTFTMSMSSAGLQVFNIALPTIGTDLGMETVTLQWLSSSYSLTNGCFLLLSGRIADVYGRKLVFITGLVWFAIWTLVGGFMKNGAALVVTRALSGCGAAMSIPSAVGIIAQNFTGRARSTAFATFSAGAPIGGAFGLILGGVFTAYVPSSWRGAAYTLAALAFAVTIVSFFVIPSDVFGTVDKRIDWVGAALITVGLVFLQFVISDGEIAPNGWKTSYIIALLIIGFLLVVAFFLWERHVINNTSRPPLMRLQLWTRAKGRLAAVYFIGFIAWMGFVSLFYFTTLFYQDIQGTGAVGAMLRFLPTSVSGITCNVIVAMLISKVRTQWLVCVGLLATGLANICMAISEKDTNYWRLPFNAMWLSVMGADFLMATGLIFVAALSLPDEHSVAGALFQTLIQLGGSFGLAVTTVISDVQQNKALKNGLDSVSAQLKGLHAAFWLGAATSFAALILAIVALRGMGTIGKGVKRSPEKEVGAHSEPQRSKGESEAEKV